MSVVNQDRDLNKLQPDFKRQVELWLSECHKNGLDIFITEAYRSQERQNYLYAQGRSRPGRVITWTLNSMHTKGLAVDIAFRGSELYPSQTDERWGHVADIGRKYGIDWAVTLWGVDFPHFQDAEGSYEEEPPTTYRNTGLPIINKKKSKAELALMVALPVVGFFSALPGGALGVYNHFSNEIGLHQDINRDVQMHDQWVNLKEYVLVHEFAHFVDRKRTSDVVSELYCERVMEGDFYPTEYSRTNCREHWAELYTGIYLELIPYDENSGLHRMVLNAMQRYEDPSELDKGLFITN